MQTNITFFFILLISWPLLAEDSFPGIRELMTDEELRASGVDQLTEPQIQALNQWLIHYTANESELIKQTTEVKQEAFQPIESAIIGTFHGWSGKTTFQLENGQIWQQRYSDQWVTKMENPKVTITQNFFGFYKLEVEGKNKTIGVKRIK